MKEFIQSKYMLLVLSVFLTSTLAAQCPPGIITLSSQAQVDQFIIDYPDCTELQRLDVTLGADITNVNGLINLEKINGDLNITHNPLLTDLSGFSNIKSTGYLWIANNTSLVNLNAFPNLENAYWLFIGDHTNLESISGFNKLNAVTNLTFINNSKLTTASGINALTQISGQFEIQNNPLLQSIDFATGLTQLGGHLIIKSNPVLQSLVTMDGITSINGALTLSGNASLTNLNAFNSLLSINGPLIIEENTLLNNISGVQSIDANSIKSQLSILNNPILKVCDLPNICTYLQGAGARNISGNSGDCVTEQAVIDQCNAPAAGCLNITSTVPQWPTTTYVPTCNSEPQVINIQCETGEYSMVAVVAGSQYIFSSSVPTDYITITDEAGEEIYTYGTSSVTWDAVSNQSIRFYLHLDEDCNTSTEQRSRIVQCGINSDCPTGDIWFNTQAELNQFILNYPNCTVLPGNVTIVDIVSSNINDLSPLNNIQTIGGDLLIENCSAISTLNGLTGLKTVKGDFYIVGNDQLQNLNGFNNLTNVAGNININGNHALIGVGLNNLIELEGKLSIDENDALTSITINGLNMIGGLVSVSENPQLLTIGLSSVSNIGDNLIIHDNASLTSVGFNNLTQIGGALQISNSGALFNVNSLSKLTNIGGALAIGYNTVLTDISALQNTTWSITNGMGLVIQDNPALSICNLPNICSYLTNPIGTHPRIISGNTGDCATEQAVSDACNPVNVPDGEYCNNAIVINTLFGHPVDEPQASGTYSTEGFNALNDPSFGQECLGANNTIWFKFTGDGQRYAVRSRDCSSAIYTNPNGAMYSGACADLNAIDCHRDIWTGDIDPDFNFRIVVQTEQGQEYYLMVEVSTSEDFEIYNEYGDFCLEVTRLDPECLVTIPDINFKNYLIENSEINTNFDDEIQCEEAENFFGTIDCSGLGIMDLTGIEAFIILGNLNCSENELSTLNLNQNKILTQLNCSSNNLTTLNVLNNTELWLLNCSDNNLTSLDVSKILYLEELDCSGNNITAVDLSSNVKISYFLANDNNLTRLDLANGNNSFFNTINIQNNSELTCIKVDDADYSNTNWIGANYSFDDQHTFNESCNPCEDIGKEVDATFLVASNGCVGDSIHFIDYTVIDLEADQIQFTWDFGDGTTSSLRDPVHNYADQGDRTVSLIVDIAGCEPIRLSKTIRILNCLKKGGSHQGYSRILPNPSNGAFRLETQLPIESDVSVRIYNAEGREVYTRQYRNTDHIVDDIVFYQPGTYFAEIVHVAGVDKVKIIILR